jgi:3-deoxy-D-manno-octulosonic-acid transferase
LARGYEDKRRFSERLGISKQKRPDGKLVWFNAVSMGEINAAWTIISRINEKNRYNILITTTSITGTETAMRKMKTLSFPERVIHQYTPIDFSFSIDRFLKHWRPDLLVNVESEFWPNIFTMTKKYCSIVVLNGKLSRKSFRFWYKFRGMKEKIFSNIDICLAQSKNDYRKFINLGVQNVQFLGNIKFFVGKSSVDGGLYEKFLGEIGARHRWMANCTHEGEEEIVMEVHQRLKQTYPDLITFLIVRHGNRISRIKKMLTTNDLKCVTTTQDSVIDSDVDFFIHDKYGDLGTFFDFCKIIFMGGSLKTGIGGHTPAESIKHQCCLVTGPYIDNNLLLFKELQKIDGCLILEHDSSDALFFAVSSLLSSPETVERISKNAYVRSIQYNSVLNEILDIILAKLE